MPVTTSHRFKPYAGTHRSLSSMFTLSKKRDDHAQMDLPVPNSPKKHSLQSIFRRVIDSFASGLNLDDEKAEPLQRAKLRRHRTKRTEIISASSENVLLPPRKKLSGLGRSKKSRVSVSTKLRSSDIPNLPSATGLEGSLSNIRISTDGRSTALMNAFQNPVARFPAASEVHLCSATETIGQPLEASSLVVDDSSESSHASSVKHSATVKPFTVRVVDREVENIPKVIVMASRTRPNSLAGQFWRRKASRVHRVDGSLLEEDTTARRARRSSAPYSRGCGQARRTRRSPKDHDSLLVEESGWPLP